MLNNTSTIGLIETISAKCYRSCDIFGQEKKTILLSYFVPFEFITQYHFSETELYNN